ncbi:AbrB family transcriptional regulator [Rhabdaerophilum sp.]|uniref:AbrB family transcriptional regulator n=1 Tax=Rhabdaerophilum sp. TaxID=2717341 RepID=UPI0038D3B147
MPDLSPLLLLGRMIVAGLAGVALFWVAGLPAPWLSGSMVGVVFLLAAGARVAMPDLLRDIGMLFAGVAMGSAITPEMIQAIGRYPLSFAILILTMIGITLVGRIVLVRFFGWQRDVALFASVPGAMSVVLATGASAGIDLSRVAVVQAFRMFVLVAILPSIVTLSTSTGRVAEVTFITAPAFALLMAVAVAIAFLFERVRVIAPFLFGGMAAGGLTHATGWLPGAPPAFIVDAAMFLIGVYAGSRIAGITLQSLRQMFLPALFSFLASMAVTAIGASLAIALAGARPAEALIAFAPGGLEAMIVLGIALGLDPLYLASHQVGRFVLIAAALPFLFRRRAGAITPDSSSGA